jgi:protein-S-isoprenylcysteine O-methyltransferase Ste14
MFSSLLKSILHNIGVVIVGFGFAYLGRRLDLLLGIRGFNYPLTTIAGWLLIIIGFLLRVWTTLYFYKQHMKVISLRPQNTLITSGPFRFSRNPLYLGGNGFVFSGTALLLGSPGAVLLTILNILLLDRWMIPREEHQLERDFGSEWIRYRKRVRRWL